MEKIKRKIIHFLIFPYHWHNKCFSVLAKSNGPNKYKHEISESLHYSIFFILFCYTKLCTDQHVNKKFEKIRTERSLYLNVDQYINLCSKTGQDNIMF